jgi:peptidoglycan/xylan/chitin deacetylase (PgdA/CDA1 family)
MRRHPVIQQFRRWGITALRTGIELSPWREQILFRLPASCDRCIALTFDDGPDPDFTPTILDLLAQYQWHGTFFLVGKRAEAHPELVRRIVNEGHAVGNHTYSHVKCSTLSLDAMQSELKQTDTWIRQAAPEIEVRWFRPPWGELTRAQRSQVLGQNRRIVLWNFTVNDHAVDSATIIKDSRNVKPRDIFLLHDRNEQTRAALPEVFRQLHASGLRSISLNEAWQLPR